MIKRKGREKDVPRRVSWLDIVTMAAFTSLKEGAIQAHKGIQRCHHDSTFSHGYRYTDRRHRTRAWRRCCNRSCDAPSSKETPQSSRRSRTTLAPTTRRLEEEEVPRRARARRPDVVTMAKRRAARCHATSMEAKRLMSLSMAREALRTSEPSSHTGLVHASCKTS
jgi:hypothetical protein